MAKAESRTPRPSNQRVAIVHHFFQHYRAGILNKLAQSRVVDAEFFGDDRDVFGSGVQVWAPPTEAVFRRTRCRLLGGQWLWQSGLQRLAWRSDIECVIFLGNPYYLATWVSAAVCRMRGKRVLFWTHGWLRPERGLKRLVRRTFFRLANGLLVYSHGAKQIAIQNGFRAKDVYVVFNSLDYEEQKDARERQAAADLEGLRSELFESPHQPIVIFSSRLQERRRLDWLIDAAAALTRQSHPINLLIIGDGPQRAELEDMSRRLDVSAHFYGACYDPDTLARLYAISNATASPGVVGLTAIQSLGFGVPVITHDSPTNQAPEAEAVVPGSTGDLFAYGDIDDLAATIKRWTTQLGVAPGIRAGCIDLVERVFNPSNQLVIMEHAVAGRPATKGG